MKLTLKKDYEALVAAKEEAEARKIILVKDAEAKAEADAKDRNYKRSRFSTTETSNH